MDVHVFVCRHVYMYVCIYLYISAAWLRDQADILIMDTFHRTDVLKVTGSNSQEEKRRVVECFSHPNK